MGQEVLLNCPKMSGVLYFLRQGYYFVFYLEFIFLGFLKTSTNYLLSLLVPILFLFICIHLISPEIQPFNIIEKYFFYAVIIALVIILLDIIVEKRGIKLDNIAGPCGAILTVSLASSASLIIVTSTRWAVAMEKFNHLYNRYENGCHIIMPDEIRSLDQLLINFDYIPYYSILKNGYISEKKFFFVKNNDNLLNPCRQIHNRYSFIDSKGKWHVIKDYIIPPSDSKPKSNVMIVPIKKNRAKENVFLILKEDPETIFPVGQAGTYGMYYMLPSGKAILKFEDGQGYQFEKWIYKGEGKLIFDNLNKNKYILKIDLEHSKFIYLSPFFKDDIND